MSDNQLDDIKDLVRSEDVRRSQAFLSEKRKVSEISLYVQNTVKDESGKERLIIFLRRHWINLFTQLFPFLILVLILIGVYFLFSHFLSVKIINEFQWDLIRLAVALLSLLLWSFLFVVFIDYYLDVWIVTNERIVNIEQKGLFRREISELRLENVQDLTTEIAGVIPTFFDFGDLFVQTAGKRERFRFKSIPHPERVRDVILVLSEES